MVENIRELVRLLKFLNVTSNAKIEEVRSIAEMHLCKHEPDELRTVASVRAEVARRARALLKSMRELSE
jgi:hypothetical protein